MRLPVFSRQIPTLPIVVVMGLLMAIAVQPALLSQDLIKESAIMQYEIILMLMALVSIVMTPKTVGHDKETIEEYEKKGRVSETALGLILCSAYGWIVLVKSPESLGSMGITIVSVAVTIDYLIVSIAEEGAFRFAVPRVAFLSGKGNRTMRFILVVFLSAVFFSILHYQTGQSTIYLDALLFGLVQSALFEVGHSFVGLVFGHTMNNIIVSGSDPLFCIILMVAFVISYAVRNK